MKTAYLYADGAARGNPGPAGAGYLLKDDEGNVAFEGCRYLGEKTNNQAEYLALTEGLVKAIEMGVGELLISLDSELIVKQIKGEYRVKNDGIKPLFKRVKELLEKFGSYSIKHIPREKNKDADRLANKAIDEAF